MALRRNTSTSEAAAFWDSAQKTADAMKDKPAWMKAGIDLNPRHFETHDPKRTEPTMTSPLTKTTVLEGYDFRQGDVSDHDRWINLDTERPVVCADSLVPDEYVEGRRGRWTITVQFEADAEEG